MSGRSFNEWGSCSTRCREGHCYERGLSVIFCGLMTRENTREVKWGQWWSGAFCLEYSGMFWTNLIKFGHIWTMLDMLDMLDNAGHIWSILDIAICNWEKMRQDNVKYAILCHPCIQYVSRHLVYECQCMPMPMLSGGGFNEWGSCPTKCGEGHCYGVLWGVISSRIRQEEQEGRCQQFSVSAKLDNTGHI